MLFPKDQERMAFRYRRSRVVYQCGYVLLALALWHFCSPYQIVLQSRSQPDPTSDTSIDIATDSPVQSADSIGEKVKDTIDKNYGPLEQSYLAQISTVNSGSVGANIYRSRDESIKLVYGITKSADWLDLVESQDDHGLMALTKATQRYLHGKQNPTDCSRQRYLILNKFPGDDAFGLGAIVQRIADYLSVALQTNSILLYAMDSSPGEHFISNSGGACGRSFDCIFERLSNCSSKDQRGIKSDVQSIFTGDGEVVDVDVEAYLAKNRWPVPPVFEEALKTVQEDVTGEMLKYWWRAQAAAYIMRFNSGASRRLREMRVGEVKQRGIRWDVNGEPKDVDMPFPMPEGTVSIHVRHGDKGSEMRLVPFNDYVVRAEKFVAENPLGTWKRAFLSTEDPNVIEQMKTMPRITPFSYSGSNSRWTWYWSDIPRLNTGPETQLKEFGNRTELTIKWLLQLTMAIECDIFVGTRGSGWNRLIDSLRCTWLASCKQPFLEVGFENDWAGYGP
ncbi:hypothetical protein Dda_0259 [Drechslerella dactyloides]|uniref:Uncharacterized protein n=1 Tax=Drechslerella dactyloides TaxID=74499 RepID=A0AAD6J7N0_DREDA|nr:hypothetical protein Dda_0259 [Drechslerella dactyloides]